MMKLNFKYSDKIITLEILKEEIIINVKKKLVELTGLKHDMQTLFYNHILLEDTMTINNYFIPENTTIPIRILKRKDKNNNNNEQNDFQQSLEDVTNCVQNLNVSDSNNRHSNKVISDPQNYHIKGDTIDDSITVYEGKNIRGICVIINNKKFSSPSLPERRGSEYDVARLRITFTKLNYRVEEFHDVKSTDMQTTLDKIKSLVKSTYKILILFAMSHGGEDYVFTTDLTKFLHSSISTPFTNGKFKIIAGKPKLFFFVCCQGKNHDQGVVVSANGVEESHLEHDGVHNTISKYTTEGDMFFGYPSIPSYVAARDINQGTIYITTLCDVINRSPEKSISDIHQEVQNIVFKRSNTVSLQLPYCVNMLTEHAYLTDKD